MSIGKGAKCAIVVSKSPPLWEVKPVKTKRKPKRENERNMTARHLLHTAPCTDLGHLMRLLPSYVDILPCSRPIHLALSLSTRLDSYRIVSYHTVKGHGGVQSQFQADSTCRYPHDHSSSNSTSTAFGQVGGLTSGCILTKGSSSIVQKRKRPRACQKLK